MNVRMHMSAPPIAITDDTDFKNALGLMQKHRIRRLPVVDAGGVVTGIVAERDLLHAADRYLNSPVDVARIMTRHVVTVGDATPVVDAAIMMIERKIGGLPVVDPGRRLLGIITETDLLKALAAMLKAQAVSAPTTKARRGATWPNKATARRKAADKRPVATKPGVKPEGAKAKGVREPTAATGKRVQRARSR